MIIDSLDILLFVASSYPMLTNTQLDQLSKLHAICASFRDVDIDELEGDSLGGEVSDGVVLRNDLVLEIA